MPTQLEDFLDQRDDAVPERRTQGGPKQWVPEKNMPLIETQLSEWIDTAAALIVAWIMDTLPSESRVGRLC